MGTVWDVYGTPRGLVLEQCGIRGTSDDLVLAWNGPEAGSLHSLCAMDSTALQDVKDLKTIFCTEGIVF